MRIDFMGVDLVRIDLMGAPPRAGVDLQELVAVLPAEPGVCENDVYSNELSD